MDKLSKINFVIDKLLNCSNIYSIHDDERIILERAANELNKIRLKYNEEENEQISNQQFRPWL